MFTGIEESHVNCLHYVKPFARLVVFTDLDDMLMPKDLSQIHPTSAIEILEVINLGGSLTT